MISNKKINLIEEKMCELCDDYTGNFISKNGIYFDFNADDECYICVSDVRLMEDEDDILAEAKAIFNEVGVKADFEWDYDAGDEYSQCASLDIKLIDECLSKSEKFKLIDDLEKLAYDEDLAEEDLEELSNALRNLRLSIEFESGDFSEDEFLRIRREEF